MIARPPPLERLRAEVPGCCELPALLHLYQTARDESQADVVEIGTLHGRTAIALAFGVLDRPRGSAPAQVFTFDSYDHGAEGRAAGVERARTHFRAFGVEGVVVPQGLSSQEAAKAWRPPGRVDMVFVDGDHGPEGAKHDLAWATRLLGEEGGVVVVDDVDGSGFPGVDEAVREFVTGPFSGRLSVLWRKPPGVGVGIVAFRLAPV